MKKLFSIIALVFALNVVAQTPVVPKNTTKLTMYVEYGGKGIKLGVIAFTDAAFRHYTPVENKELNIGLSKNFQSNSLDPLYTIILINELNKRVENSTSILHNLHLMSSPTNPRYQPLNHTFAQININYNCVSLTKSTSFLNPPGHFCPFAPLYPTKLIEVCDVCAFFCFS